MGEDDVISNRLGRVLARIAVDKGEIEKARNLLEQLIESVPDSVFRQESETLLLTL